MHPYMTLDVFCSTPFGGNPLCVFPEGHEIQDDAIAAAIGLDRNDLRPGESSAYSCGTPYLLVPLRSREALSRACLHGEEYHRSLSHYWARAIYLFFLNGKEIHARMFGPELGIREDPATGSAAAALSGWLARSSDGRQAWKILQGEDMGRPSVMELEALCEKGLARSCHTSGTSVPMASGHLGLPD